MTSNQSNESKLFGNDEDSRSERHHISQILPPIHPTSQSHLYSTPALSSVFPVTVRRGPGRPRKDASGRSRHGSSRPGSRSQSRSGKSGRKYRASGSSSGPPQGTPRSSSMPFRISASSSTSSPSAGSSSSPGTPAVTGSSGSGDNNSESPQYEPLQPEPRRCILCFLTENNSFGLGPLAKCPFFENEDQSSNEDVCASNPQISTERQNTSTTTESDLTLRINLKQSRIVRTGFKKYGPDEADEWECIGLPDEFDLNLLKQRNEAVYIHRLCAIWAMKGRVTENLLAIVTEASKTRCAVCSKRGAWMKCRCAPCNRSFHFTCAQIHGCLFDKPSFSLICAEHAMSAKSLYFELRCAVCGSDKDFWVSLLFCEPCGRHVHVMCGTKQSGQDGTQLTTVIMTPALRAGWNCANCSNCRKCRSVGDQGKLVACDLCQKFCHTYCSIPTLTSVPKGGYKCVYCRKCEDCGSRTPGSGQSSRWHSNYSVCDSCYQQRNKGCACTVCGKAYRLCDQKFMRECINCRKYIHDECDPPGGVINAPGASSNYTCRVCRERSGSSCGHAAPNTSISTPTHPTNSSLSGIEQQQTPASLSNYSISSNTNRSSSIYSNDENDEDILNDILKSDALPSPLSDLDISCIEGADNFNLDTWTAVVDEEFGAGASHQDPFSTGRIGPNAPPPIQSSSIAFSGRKRLSNKRGSKGNKYGGGRHGSAARRKTRSQTNLAPAEKPQQTSTISSSELVIAPVKVSPDGDEYTHTLVVDNLENSFIFNQDICIVCGSIGKGAEADMIPCYQCGQCYHLYCADVKLNAVVVKRGWRCLNCTICEGCGKGDDEQHILLCDECDFSIHTYCLDPPLSNIPSGSWTCQWCSRCYLCELPLPPQVLRLDGLNNHTKDVCRICTKCESSYSCPLCRIPYRQGDYVIKCEKCQKWSHGKCNGLLGEESVDRAADLGFKCTMCKPGQVYTLEDIMPERIPEPVHNVDGILITKTGIGVLKWKPGVGGGQKRQTELISGSQLALGPDCKPNLSITAGSGSGDANAIETVAAIVSKCHAESRQASHLASRAASSFMSPDDNAAKRSIKLMKRLKAGLGGFSANKPVRHRTSTNNNADLISPKSSSIDIQNTDSNTCASQELDVNSFQAPESGETLAEESADPTTAARNSLTPAEMQVKRRKRQRRKGPIDDAFPLFIQEAFFGNALTAAPPTLGLSHKSLQRSETLTVADFIPKHEKLIATPLPKPVSRVDSMTTLTSQDLCSIGDNLDHLAAEQGTDFLNSGDATNLNPSTDFSNILDMLMNEDIDQVLANSGAASTHRASIDSGNSSSGMECMSAAMSGHPFTQIRSSVHATSNSSSPRLLMPPQTMPSSRAMGVAPSVPMQHPVMMANAHLPQQQQQPLTPGNFAARFAGPVGQYQNLPRYQQPDVAFRQQAPFGNVPLQGVGMGTHPGPANNNPGVADGNQTQTCLDFDSPNSNLTSASSSFGGGGGGVSNVTDSKSTLDRWESDEPLGDRATTAAVLYTNIHHPDLNLQFPAWPERAKQIGKLWRLLSPEQRQHFVLLARENRTNVRQTFAGKIKRTSDGSLSFDDMTPQTPLENPLMSTGVVFKVPPTPTEFFTPQQLPCSTIVGQQQQIMSNPYSNLPQAQNIGIGSSTAAPRNQTPMPMGMPYQQPPLPAASGHFASMDASQMIKQEFEDRPHSQFSNPVSFPAYQYPNPEIQDMKPFITTPAETNTGQPTRDFKFESEVMQERRKLALEQQHFENKLIELRRAKKSLMMKRRQHFKIAESGDRPMIIDADSDRKLSDISAQILDIQKSLEPIKRRSKYQTGILREYRRRMGLSSPHSDSPNQDSSLDSNMTSPVFKLETPPKRKWVRRKKPDDVTSNNLNEISPVQREIATLLSQVIESVCKNIDGENYVPIKEEEYSRNTLLKNLLMLSTPTSSCQSNESSLLDFGTKRSLSLSSSDSTAFPIRKRVRRLKQPSLIGNNSTPGGASLSNQSALTTRCCSSTSSSLNLVPQSPLLGSATSSGIVSTDPSYAAFLQRLVTKLTARQKVLPSNNANGNGSVLALKEPPPRPDAFLVKRGVTALADKIVDRFSKVAVKSGHMALNFARNPYAMLLSNSNKEAPPIRLSGSRTIVEKPPLPPVPRPVHKITEEQKAFIMNRIDTTLDMVCGNIVDFEEDITMATYPALKPNLASGGAGCEGRMSPNFRLTAHVPYRAQPADPPISVFDQTKPRAKFVKQKAATEEPCVPVTLTITREAAANIKELLRGLSALLGVEIQPHDYELQLDTPPSSPVVRNAPPKLVCKMCQVAVDQAAVTKKSTELGISPKNEANEEVHFCSMACFQRFSSTIIQQKQNLALKSNSVNPTNQEPHLSSVADGSKSSSSSSELRIDEIICKVAGGAGVSCGGATVAFLQLTSNPYGGLKNSEQALTLRDLNFGGRHDPSQQAHHAADRPGEFGRNTSETKWRGTRWTLWTNVDSAKARGEEVTLEKLRFYLSKIICQSAPNEIDQRICQLCSDRGDDETSRCGRLLNCDACQWVHINCALWSAEVYETMDGGLVNVEKAIKLAKKQSCCLCKENGASLTCNNDRCSSVFHFRCALEARCVFTKEKAMFCHQHPPPSFDAVLYDFSVLRRIFIDRDENHLLAKLYQQTSTEHLALRIGSLIFRHVGQLLPHQLKQFSTDHYIYPVGFDVSRIFWSTSSTSCRTVYTCTIEENQESEPEFSVSFKTHQVLNLSEPDHFETTRFAGSRPSEPWSHILQGIEKLRLGKKNTLKLFSQFLPGEFLFGLNEPSVTKIVESLPGVETLLGYDFKYGKHPLMDLPLAVNPSGCARCEPRFRTYLKKPLTVGSVSGSASASGQQLSWHTMLSMSGLGGTDTTWALLGGRPSTVSKWSQYRRMKQEWRNMVFLARSKIQGLGLYAKRTIDMHAIIIEYIGEIIRNEVAERREKMYESHGRGVYMFRVNQETVIDATITGGPARYINHSCDPNCVTDVIQLNNCEMKIVIAACRPITEGEELTYDYQFDLEDDTSKLPCLCGAPNCRKWMN